MMSVVLLTSACGAPGVTTTTMGLACTWTRRVIVAEVDPVGGAGILAGYFRGFQAPTQSVVDLLMAHRANRLSEQFPQSLIPIKSTTASVLPGPRSHGQAFSVLDLWEPLSLIWKGLNSAETDVLIDAGRLGMQSYAESLLSAADLVLLVTRSDLPSIAATKQWSQRAAETKKTHPEAPDWAVVLVGPGKPYSAHEVSSVLGLPVLSQLSLDHRGAAVYSHGTTLRGRNRLRSDLIRCGEQVRSMVSASAQLLTPKVGS